MKKKLQSIKGPLDNLDDVCIWLMIKMRKEFRGHKTEISPRTLTKRIKRFAFALGMKEDVLIDALFRRGWLEPSAADTYIIRYDLMRK